MVAFFEYNVDFYFHIFKKKENQGNVSQLKDIHRCSLPIILISYVNIGFKINESSLTFIRLKQYFKSRILANFIKA